MMQALLGGACGTGIDVWSLGCLLAEVALQRPLFPVATTAELVHQVTGLTASSNKIGLITGGTNENGSIRVTTSI